MRNEYFIFIRKGTNVIIIRLTPFLYLAPAPVSKKLKLPDRLKIT